MSDHIEFNVQVGDGPFETIEKISAILPGMWLEDRGSYFDGARTFRLVGAEKVARDAVIAELTSLASRLDDMHVRCHEEESSGLALALEEVRARVRAMEAVR